MLSQTKQLAGNFDTKQDAELAQAMLCTFAAMHGCAIPEFTITHLGKNFYRLLQKTPKLPV
jgi:hypothetical protein